MIQSPELAREKVLHAIQSSLELSPDRWGLVKAALLEEQVHYDAPALEEIRAEQRRDNGLNLVMPAEEGWDEIISLEDHKLVDFPADVIGGAIGLYAAALTAATETPTALSAMMALGVVSATLAGKVEVEVKPGYAEPVQIWVCPILDSGERKSAVVNKLSGPITRFEREQFETIKLKMAEADSTRKSLEAVIGGKRKALEKATAEEQAAAIEDITNLELELPLVPKLPRYVTSDCTTEQLAMLASENDGAIAIVTDEPGILDILAGRYSQVPNLDFYLQGYSGSPVRIDRRSREPILIDRPALTMAVSPQPIAMKVLAEKGVIRGRGLLGRFLFGLPESKLGTRTGITPPIPEEVERQYDIAIRSLLGVVCQHQ